MAQRTAPQELVIASRRSPAIEPKHADYPNEDALLEIISDIEQRLEDIRASTAEQHALEAELSDVAGTLEHRQQAIVGREDTLRRAETDLASRSAELVEDRSRIEQERRAIESKVAEIREKEAMLAHREAEQEGEVEELIEARTALIQSRESLRELEGSLATREQDLEDRSAHIEQERGALELQRNTIRSEREKLGEQAAAQQQRDQELQMLKQSIDQREQELSAKLGEYDSMRARLEELAEELSRTKTQAKKSAEEAEESRAAGEQRIHQLLERCETLENERVRIRTELTRTKRELSTASTLQARAATMVGQMTKGSRGPLAVATWVVVMFVSTLAALMGLEGQIGLAGGMFGLALAGCLIASQGIAKRLWDPAVLPLALFAASFGVWFPAWIGASSTAVEVWQLPVQALPEPLIAVAPTGFAVLSAGLAIVVGLYLMTASATLLGQGIFATLIATMLVMLPGGNEFTAASAAILWQALVAAALGRWALQMRQAVAPQLMGKAARPI